MQLVVLIKQTFDTEEKIELANGAVAEDGVKFIMNPYDEYALEEALRLREAHGGSVTVVSCGTDRATETLRTALAMGADEAVLIAQDGLPDDGSAVAAVLATAVRELKPDLVLAGLFAVDRGAGSIALQVAERLGLPSASAVLKLSVEDGGGAAGGQAASRASWGGGDGRIAVAERDTEWGVETVAIPLPALITAQQGLNEPRYPSLPGIMKAKRKPLRQLGAAELGLDAAALAPRTERASLLPPPARAAGRKLSGAPAEQAEQLAELLQREAKLF
ncbi:electron transfer flavoprotein subunit beta/FixA family protein [Paenibacillus sacheonensis]|uniref:Electron transfer flavoprotein subunit beta n=1 Tax=Paenibacillus sacheonensis TaxID=742054 RepID=A0A7X4YUB3_9BACL|nr:electron transfer flavoprotein subunit beta/FixA family protein [Paenibacillus sacheonensis]MBM7568941.1 electron transfer flavoprotein beta subunit [Paenibacillus sacheonensis]NBC72685.1 electron transfer flavoprotein subunit beta [Paenibacillus sacheonensis]